MNPEHCDCDCHEYEDPRDPIVDRDELRTWRITISANRETSRLQRMADVARRVFGADPGVGDKIDTLHDHKGTMTVTWFRRPTEHDRKVVQQAWEAECECDIEHVW